MKTCFPLKLTFRSLLLMLVFLNYSCKKDQQTLLPPQQNDATEGVPIQLGEKLKNPYSIANMRQAYLNILKNQRMGDEFPSPEEMEEILVPTNTYYRTLPETEEAYNALKEDTTKEYFDFPLDYEVSDGNNYHDESLPDSAFTWQYTVVKNEDLPQQRGTSAIEILTSDIFLPENSPYYNEYDTAFWNAIEDEALILAGYPEEAAAAPNWQGFIKIYEIVEANSGLNVERIVPLQGAKVVGRNFWRHAYGYTNINGGFELNKDLRGQISFFIKWERPGKYDIRSGWYVQAWTVLGKKPNTQWEHIIQKNDHQGFDVFYGSIHRGAYDFFYKDPFGFSKPSARVKIGAMKGNGTGVNAHAASILAGPDLKVYKKYDNQNRSTMAIYGTTIHELGHSSHRSLGVNQLFFCSKMFRESYANMIEWLFCTAKYFPDELDEDADFYFNLYSYKFVEYYLTIEGNTSESHYTPIFIDVVDVDINNTRFGPSIQYQLMNEEIIVSPLDIENFLKNKAWNVQVDKNLEDLRDYLKTLPQTNTTMDASIDNYINTYYLPYSF